MLVLMTMMGLTGCSNHENDDVVYDEKNPIVGRWELYEIEYAFSAPLAIEKRRDSMFSLKTIVCELHVITKTGCSFLKEVTTNTHLTVWRDGL